MLFSYSFSLANSLISADVLCAARERCLAKQMKTNRVQTFSSNFL